MNRIIPIRISNKIATVTNREAYYVCGNSDFKVVFDFDDDWEGYKVKTARFTYEGKYQDVVFEGNECPVPIILGTKYVDVGVYIAGEISSTPARMRAKECILDEGLPEDPTPELYVQILEEINKLAILGIEDGEGDGSLKSSGATAALGEGSVALGQGAVASQNGYYIRSINTNINCISLETTAEKKALPLYTPFVMGDIYYNLGYEVGDVFSINNGAHYDFCGKITNIVGSNVYFEPELPFDSIEGSFEDRDDHTFFVPAKPLVGIVTGINPGNISAGLNTVASGKGSTAMGRDTIAADYAVAIGRKLIAAYCSAVFGLNNEARGRYAFAVGQLCKALGEYSAAINMGCIAEGEASFAHGKGAIAYTEAMEAGGKYNKSTSDKIVVYGNGNSSTRKDAYWLDWSGNGYYAGNLRTIGHVNTKFTHEDYFDNGKVYSTIHGKKSFDDFTEPGYYHFVWYHKNDGGEEEITPWNIIVGVKKVNGKTTRIFQTREAYGQNTGKEYYKQTRVGNLDSSGNMIWSDWTKVN